MGHSVNARRLSVTEGAEVRGSGKDARGIYRDWGKIGTALLL